MGHYREQWGYNQTDLHHLLQDSYPISVSEINRYEAGKRTPPPEFVYHLSVCLELSQADQKALIEAWFADVKVHFWERFNNEAISRGQPSPTEYDP